MFRKPKKKPASLRSGGNAKRSAASGGVGDTEGNDAGASNGRPRMKRLRPGGDGSSSSDEEDGRDSTGGLLEQIRKERDEKSIQKQGTQRTASSKTDKSEWMHQYKSSADRLTAKEMATRTGEYQSEEPKGGSDSRSGDASIDDTAGVKEYRGDTSKSQPRNKFLAGPLRAATFVRTTARFDYQPDICKDYKETGFCGFGDTCIYLHDRGDTKTGWQMELEYEEKKRLESVKKEREMDKFMESMQRQDQEGGSRKEETDIVADDGLPFACHICRTAFRNPVVVTCQHYFCEKCILDRVRGGDAVCPICRKDTHGVFNHPQKLVSKKRRLVGRDGTWEEYRDRAGKKESASESE